MISRTIGDLEREAEELAMTLDRRSERLGAEAVTALRGRVDELLFQCATMRYENEKHDRSPGPGSSSGPGSL